MDKSSSSMYITFRHSITVPMIIGEIRRYLRFIHGKTQMEVSKEIGISQAQVSRLEKGVIDKIKS